MNNESGTRVCKGCLERLPLEMFWFENKKAGRRHYRCKDCLGSYIKKWNGENRGRRLAVQKDYRERSEIRFKRYGLTRAAYDEILEAQMGKCLICDYVAVGRDLHIDHCHDSGKVRGLLCSQCNTAIGKLGHSPATALRAAVYLRLHQGVLA